MTNVLSKEDFFDYFKKFDAVGLQGVILSNPQTGGGHTSHYYAGLYAWLMERYRQDQENLQPTESLHHTRLRLLRMAEDRIRRDDVDDLLTILSA